MADGFPRYLMQIGDGYKFLPLREAGIAFDNGFEKVDTAGFVLNEDLSVRRMTKEEERRISDIADEYSASK